MPCWFLTFTCYGTHLHGAPTGSYERRPTGTRPRPPHPGLEAAMRRALAQEPYELTNRHRPLVLEAIQEFALRKGWSLLALHVRTTHLYVVLDAPTSAHQTLISLKAAASQALNLAGLDPPGRRRWTRHGSTRHLQTPAAINAAIHYVAHSQGEPMALYVASRTGNPSPEGPAS